MDSDIREPLNIGSDEMVSINQMVDVLESISNITLERRYDLTAPKGVRGRNSDNSKIQSLLLWKPEISLLSGLTDTYNWVYGEIPKNVE